MPGHLWNEQVIGSLRRSGLMSEQAGDFVFLHQTLVEFLAARYVAADPFLSEGEFGRIFGQDRGTDILGGRLASYDLFLIAALHINSSRSTRLADALRRLAARKDSLGAAGSSPRSLARGISLEPSTIQSAASSLAVLANTAESGDQRVLAAQSLAHIGDSGHMIWVAACGRCWLWRWPGGGWCIVGSYGSGDLSAPEKALWSSFPRGSEVDLRSGDPGADDPAAAAAGVRSRRRCQPERRILIRGRVTAGQCLDRRVAQPGRREGCPIREGSRCLPITSASTGVSAPGRRRYLGRSCCGTRSCGAGWSCPEPAWPPSGAGSAGLHAGDLLQYELDLTVQNFSGTGSIGVHLDNAYYWTEQLHGRIYAQNCASHVVFDSTGTVATSSGSFEHCELDIYIDHWEANRDGVVFANGAYTGNGSLRIRGNFSPSSSPVSSAVLRLTGSLPPDRDLSGASGIINGMLDVGVECGTGAYTPQTIAFGSSGNAIWDCYGALNFGIGGDAEFLPVQQ